MILYRTFVFQTVNHTRLSSRLLVSPELYLTFPIFVHTFPVLLCSDRAQK